MILLLIQIKLYNIHIETENLDIGVSPTSENWRWNELDSFSSKIFLIFIFFSARLQSWMVNEEAIIMAYKPSLHFTKFASGLSAAECPLMPLPTKPIQYSTFLAVSARHTHQLDVRVTIQRSPSSL